MKMSSHYKVAVFLIAVAATRTEAFTGTLCEQEPSWGKSFCGNIYNCVEPNNRLNSLVASRRDVIDEAAFGLMEPTNVTTLESLYTELKKYKGWLAHLDDALEAYMATPEYKQESIYDDVSSFTGNYTYRSKRLNPELDGTVTTMSQKASGADEGKDAVINGGDSIKNLEVISADSNYVTARLKKVLELWANECDLCFGQVRRRRNGCTCIDPELLRTLESRFQ